MTTGYLTIDEARTLLQAGDGRAHLTASGCVWPPQPQTGGGAGSYVYPTAGSYRDAAGYWHEPAGGGGGGDYGTNVVDWRTYTAPNTVAAPLEFGQLPPQAPGLTLEAVQEMLRALDREVLRGAPEPEPPPEPPCRGRRAIAVRGVPRD